MPALPWKTVATPAADADYLVVASTLPLRHYRHVPAFLRASLGLRGPLAASAGLFGYALDADLVHKTFRTLSVWRDEASMSAFAGSPQHLDVVRAFGPYLGESALVTWTARGPLPGWDTARRRLTAG